MIAYIKGTLQETSGNCCIILTPGGVGYRVAIPAHTLARLPGAGSPFALYTYLSIREDAQELYGFETFAERQTFDILKGINKVGPRTAMAILSQFRPSELEEIVRDENLAALTRVPGIGKKTAQHILLELHYKLRPSGGARQATAAPTASGDVLAALANLGYSEEECSPVVKRIFEEDSELDVASAIRMALKEMGKIKQTAK